MAGDIGGEIGFGEGPWKERGSGRGGDSSRSTRNVGQSRRSVSHATRYQRCPQLTSRCGSARGPLVRAVPEPDPVVLLAGGGQGREHARVVPRRRPVRRHLRLDSVEPAAEAGREHRLQLDQRRREISSIPGSRLPPRHPIVTAFFRPLRRRSAVGAPIAPSGCVRPAPVGRTPLPGRPAAPAGCPGSTPAPPVCRRPRGTSRRRRARRPGSGFGPGRSGDRR